MSNFAYVGGVVKAPVYFDNDYLCIDLDIYREMNFKVMVIDEAQNIKNPTAMLTKSVKSIKSTVKVALTGTPIENSILELWSIFDYIMPGFLSSKNKFKEK